MMCAGKCWPCSYFVTGQAADQDKTKMTGSVEPIDVLNLTGYYMYRQFNIQQFYVLLTQCMYVFCADLRTNSDYFPIQHLAIDSRHQFPSVRLSLQHMLSSMSVLTASYSNLLLVT